MNKRPTITLGICLAAGIAAGIGLARPGSTVADAGPSATAAVQNQAQTQEQSTPTDDGGSNGYGNSGDASSAPHATVAAGQQEASVIIAGFDFGNPITVSSGASVAVTNSDGASHTLTAEAGQFDTGVISGSGNETFTAPTAPGTYTFFCSIHPDMQGSLTVG